MIFETDSIPRIEGRAGSGLHSLDAATPIGGVYGMNDDMMSP